MSRSHTYSLHNIPAFPFRGSEQPTSRPSPVCQHSCRAPASNLQVKCFSALNSPCLILESGTNLKLLGVFLINSSPIWGSNLFPQCSFKRFLVRNSFYKKKMEAKSMRWYSPVEGEQLYILHNLLMQWGLMLLNYDNLHSASAWNISNERPLIT